MPVNAHRHLLAITSLLTLLACLPVSGIGLLLLSRVSDHAADGLCYAGQPLWAIGQALIAVAAAVLAAKAGLGGLSTAASGARDRPRRWLWLACAVAAITAWVLVAGVLAPEPQSVPEQRCA